MKSSFVIKKVNLLVICASLFLLHSFVICVSIVEAGTPAFRLRSNNTQQEYTKEDIEVEIEFGRNLAARILSTYPLVDNQVVQTYINLLGNGIAAQLGRPELQYYFGVLNTNDINAYACPGGYIFITKGALKSMKNEAQLAGVIAHEIGHVNRRHVVKPLRIRAKGDTVTSGVAAAIGGGTAAARVFLNQLTEKAFSLLFEEGVSHEFELEADTSAIEGLIEMGYDWRSYKHYISIIGSKANNKYRKVLSKTHPSSAKRISHIESLSQSLNIDNLSGKKNEQRYENNIRLF